MQLEFLFFIIINILFSLTQGAIRSKEAWKSRTIYELLTDRFAKEGEDSKVNCDLSNYCGGTFKGIQ